MFSFITINVNDLHDPNNRMSFLQWLSHLSADIVCLQETRVSSCAEADSWFSSFGFLVHSSPGSIRLCGSVILYRPTFVLAKSFTDRDVRFVFMHFKKDDLLFGVTCLYAPNRNPDRNEFFDYCADQIDPSVPTLLCGDFNTVFDRALDCHDAVPDSCHESSIALGNLFHILSVSDVWRFVHPASVAFT